LTDFHGTVTRQLSWTEISKLSVEQDGADLILYATIVAGDLSESRLKLLDLGDVREPADEIQRAVAATGPDGLLEIPRTSTAASFTIVLRGFDVATVDAAVDECEDAMLQNDADRASHAVQAFLASPPAVVMRGYDRSQVEAYFQNVTSRIADETV
jgi:hypothetical protein